MSNKHLTPFLLIVGSLLIFSALFPNSFKNQPGKPCVIIKQIPDKTETHCPKVVIRYTNTPFEAETPLHCVETETAENAMLERYPIGSAFTCWPQPDNTVTFSPSQSKVQQTINKTFLLFGIGLLLIGLFFKKKEKQETSTVLKEDKKLSPAKNIFLLALFTTLSFIFICIGFYLIYKEWRAENIFKPTSCKILNKSMTESYSTSNNRNRTTYGISLYLTYKADEKTFEAWHMPMLDGNYSENKNQQQEKLDHYIIGHEYPCWYDPSSPNVVILEHGSYLGPLFFISIALLLFITGIYSLITAIRNLEKRL